MKFIKAIPLAVSGISLACAALSNLLELPGLREIFGVLSAILLLMFLLRIVFDFSGVKAELNSALPLSALPTSTMALMLLSTYAQSAGISAALYLWFFAIIAHVFIMFLFIKRFVVAFKIENVFPSWFVAFVGIVTVSTTAPAMNMLFIGQTVFYIGLFNYFVCLILVTTRLFKIKSLPEPARPTIAIFTAPMNLLLVGYFNSFSPHERSAPLVYVMLTISIISFIFVSVKMVSLLKIKFYPTYAAFTFPFVISATSFRICNNYLSSQGYFFLTPIANVSFWMAMTVVLYVLARYITYFIFALKPK